MFTYVIVTRALLEELFSSFSLPPPDVFKVGPGVPLLIPNDTLPSGISDEEVAYVCAFVLCAGISIFSADLAPAQFENNGRAHSFDSLVPFINESWNGWVGIETVLVSLDNYFAPNATFPVWGTGSTFAYPDGANTRVGFDAVVCVKMYEPWIVQIYNSSLGIPTTMTIVGKSASTDLETDDGNRGPHLDSYTRALNSTGKDPAYLVMCVGSFFHLNATDSFSLATTTASFRC